MILNVARLSGGRMGVRVLDLVMILKVSRWGDSGIFCAASSFLKSPRGRQTGVGMLDLAGRYFNLNYIGS